MSAYDDIEYALNERLGALGGLPAIAKPNVAFDPARGSAYVEPTLMFARTIAAAVGASAQNYISGIYQISIREPIGNGDAALRSLRDSILDQFKRGLILTRNSNSLTIERSWPAAEPLRESDVWYHLPISVQFYCYADN